jgi:alpha-beta hydrolase superfamily lysophospholipase
MILRTEEVTQPIEGGVHGRFVKELIHVAGPQPLAIVRKRLPASAVDRSGYRAAVLLTHGFGQNRYAWHLSNRSFVNYLAARGYDVFNLDLRGHGRSRTFGSKPAHCIDDYIREDMPAAIAEVQAISGRDRIFVVGHSMGGLIACAMAGRTPRPFAGIVTVGTPYHFGQGSAAMAFLMRLADLAASAGILRAGPSGFPVRAISLFMQWYRFAWDASALPLPIRPWHPGSFEKPLLVEYLKRTFDTATVGTLLQMARLAMRGEFVSLDGRENYSTAIESLDVPLLVVAGDHDLLAPPPAVRPLYDRSHSRDRSYRVFPFGHADLLLGKDAPASVWRSIEGWIADRLENVTGIASRAL